MDHYALRTLRGQPLRLALTVGGVSLCLVLMIFLLAVYRGVADGSVDYIRRNKADLWVLQRNASNILRGSSLVSGRQGAVLERIPGVATAAPVLFLLTTLRRGNKSGTVYLTGYEPGIRLGGPPELDRGRGVRADDEIVLDRSFALKLGFRVGDAVDLQGRRLRVVGISRRTNAFVIQYAFVTLRFARSLAGFPGLSTCFLVRTKPGLDPGLVRRRIKESLPGLEVYDRAVFLENNIREMRSGFLPLLYTVAGLGAVVLTVILSLLLSVNILERKKDFAILKTVGAPMSFLWRLVAWQALIIATASALASLLVYFPLVLFVERISPEVSTKTTAAQIALVVVMAELMSLASSLMTVRRLRKIFHMEVFA